jgi:hypothetical protein
VLAEVFGQQPEDARQHPALGSAHIHGAILAGNRDQGNRVRGPAPPYSTLMPASSITLRQRSTSLR